MDKRCQFQKKVAEILQQIGSETFAYEKDEFWMIRPLYENLEYFASDQQLLNTAIALPLSRGLHNGTYRKAKITRNGTSYRLPYVIHPLNVCRMLADLQINLPKEDLDILLAAALCHDMVEDLDFSEGGMELVTKYHLDPRVLETVLLLSKNRNATPEEEIAHFHGIEANPLSLLIKLSDRGNNVEDLYNRSCWKVHEYVGETNRFFVPMLDYGMKHYPDLTPALAVLGDKIHTLAGVAEILVERYERRSAELERELETLKEENERLRNEWKALLSE